MLPGATQLVTIPAPFGILSMLAILSLLIDWAPAEATPHPATHTAADISRFIIVSFVWVDRHVQRPARSSAGNLAELRSDLPDPAEPLGGIDQAANPESIFHSVLIPAPVRFIP